MGALADEYVRVRADTSYMGRDLKKQGATSGKTFGGAFSGALKAVFAGAAIIGAAKVLGGALKAAVIGASDLNETINKSNTIFGKNAGVINKWAGTAATSLGLSKQEALAAAASFGDMFMQIGFTDKAATNMSKATVQLAADLGSFNNLPTADVQERIAAAFRGEYDSLQKVIPNINAARVQQVALNETGKKSAKQLTAQEKAHAVLSIIQKDGKRAAGDFARTQDDLANQVKAAKAQLKNMSDQIGTAFLPILKDVFNYINKEIIPAFQGFFDQLAKDKALKTAITNLKDALVTLTGNKDFKATLDGIAKALPGIVQGLADIVTKYKEISDAVDKFENMSFGEGDARGGPVGQIIKDFKAGGTIETAIIQFREWAPAKVKEAFTEIKSAIAKLKIDPWNVDYDKINQGIADWILSVTTKLDGLSQSVIAWATGMWDGVETETAAGTVGVDAETKSLTDKIVQYFKGLNSDAEGNPGPETKKLTERIVLYFKDMNPKVVTEMDLMWADVLDSFTVSHTAIGSEQQGFKDQTVQSTTDMGTRVKDAVKRMWADVSASWVGGTVKNGGEFGRFKDAVVAKATELKTRVVDWVKRMWAEAKASFIQNHAQIGAQVSGWKGRLIAYVTDLKTRFVSWVKRMWSEAKTSFVRTSGEILADVNRWKDKVVNAFTTAKTNIKKIWDGLKTVVSTPITWIKNNVYNKPLVPVWNRVAKLVGGTELKAYREGGKITGPRHGRDNVLGVSRSGGATAMVEPGEWIAPRWMSSLFPQLESIRKRGRAALQDVGDPKSLPGFAGGGLVGWLSGLASNVSSKVGDLKDWALGGLRDLAGKLLDPVKTLIDKAMPSNGLGNTVGSLGKKAINLILDKIKTDDAAAMPALGGPAGSAIASGGWASIYRVLRAAGARSFTTYPGHDQGASRSRDVWPASAGNAVSEAARRLSSVWYVIWNRRIASVTTQRRWIPYTRSNPHTDHVHVTLLPG